METPHVFLDTEVFDRNNFNFSSRPFAKLLSLVQEGTAVVHLTQVTVREIQNHIRAHVTEAFTRLKKVSRERTVQHFASLPNAPFRPIPRDADPEPLVQDGLERLNAFLREAGVHVIPVNTVSIDEVFDQYFGSKPPFDSGPKKSEFPDAFALMAVRQWCEQENSRIYVVSNDKGLRDACDGCDAVMSLSTLDEFLDLAARQREELYAFANGIFGQLKKEVLEDFKEEFQSIFFYIDESDSDVSDVEVDKIEVTEELAISVEANEALFEITADVTFKANYSYADYIVENVIVSREEGILERTIEVHAEVGLLYDQADPEATQLHFVSIREDDINIDLQPDPYDLK